MNWAARNRTRAPGNLAWTRKGSGLPVLLIHGVGLRAESMAGVQDALSVDHDVFAVDLPGHGDSPPPAISRSLADYTDPVATALSGTGERAIVVGHSMGAMIALDLAIRYRPLCRAVIALNAIYRRSPEAARAVRARADAIPAHAAADPSDTIRRWFGDAPRDAAATACRHWLLGNDPRAYKDAYTVFSRENGPADDDLASLECPALFVTGADEPNSTPGMSRSMAAITPRGSAVVVPGAAHMMPMTHVDAVEAAIRDFLSRHEDTLA